MYLCDKCMVLNHDHNDCEDPDNCECTGEDYDDWKDE